MKKNNIIEFHKRFANGEQNISMSFSGEIVTITKTYYWQEAKVFNHIKPLIEKFMYYINERQIDYTTRQLNQFLYGKDGFVSEIVPVQRAFNNVKNRKTEIMNRLVYGILCVEDGSVDIENLEEEGLQPGKVLVYRQGADLPRIIEPFTDVKALEYFDKEEDKLLTMFDNICNPYNKAHTFELYVKGEKSDEQNIKKHN